MLVHEACRDEIVDAALKTSRGDVGFDEVIGNLARLASAG